MTVVSSKEFTTNHDKYFKLALNEQVYIKKDSNMFIVTRANETDEADIIFEPDEDFYSSITMEEVRDRLHRVIDRLYAKQ